MRVELTKYRVIINQIFDSDNIEIAKDGTELLITNDTFKTLASNGYVYIIWDLGFPHSTQVKILLSDIKELYRIDTCVTKVNPINPEIV